MHAIRLARSSRRLVALAAAVAAAAGVAGTSAPTAHAGVLDGIAISTSNMVLQPLEPVTFGRDLIVSRANLNSASNVTVKNIGTVAAGSSILRVGTLHFTIPALAPGQSYGVLAGNLCEGTITATADVFNQVPEANELNNSRQFQVIC